MMGDSGGGTYLPCVLIVGNKLPEPQPLAHKSKSYQPRAGGSRSQTTITIDYSPMRLYAGKPQLH